VVFVPVKAARPWPLLGASCMTTCSRFATPHHRASTTFDACLVFELVALTNTIKVVKNNNYPSWSICTPTKWCVKNLTRRRKSLTSPSLQQNEKLRRKPAQHPPNPVSLNLQSRIASQMNKNARSLTPSPSLLYPA
jgi:hypothetical protein